MEYLYASDVEVPKEKGEDISKRTKNALFFKGKLKDNKQEWTGRFYTGEPFYEENNIWYQTKIATTTPDAFDEQMGFRSFIEKAFAAEDIDYAGAGDGGLTVQRSDGGTYAANWDNARGDDGTNISANYGTDTTGYPIMADLAGSPIVNISRGFFTYDTSEMGAGASVTTSTLNIYVIAKGSADNDGDDFIVVIQTTQASGTVLADLDYNNITLNTPTEGSDRLDISATIATGAYNTWTLDADGKGWIDPTGWTLLGIREGHDVLDNIITVVSGNNYIQTRFSEYAGTASDPYLETTYTVSAVRRIIMNYE